MEIKFLNQHKNKSYTIDMITLPNKNNEENFWLSDEEGRGMPIPAFLIYELIDEFFRKNY